MSGLRLNVLFVGQATHRRSAMPEVLAGLGHVVVEASFPRCLEQLNQSPVDMIVVLATADQADLQQMLGTLNRASDPPVRWLVAVARSDEFDEVAERLGPAIRSGELDDLWCLPLSAAQVAVRIDVLERGGSRGEAAVSGALRLMAEDRPLHEVYQQTVWELGRLAPRAAACLRLIDQHSGRLRLIESHGLPDPMADHLAHEAIGLVANSPCATAVQERRPLLADAFFNEPRWPAFREVAGHCGLDWCLCVPVMAGPTLVLGSLCVLGRSGTSADARLQGRVETLARTLSLTLARRVVDERLQRTTRRLQECLDAAHDGIWEADVDAPRIVLNTAGERLLGLESPPASHDLGGWMALLAADDQATVAEILRPVLVGQQSRFQHEQCLRPEGQPERWVAVDGQVVARHPGGRAARLVGSLRDITQEKQLAERLRNAEQAADTGGMPPKLLSEMSHNLRTPLNVILGMSDLLLHGQTTSEQREGLTTIRDSGRNLLRMLSDIFDAARIKSGQVRLRQATFQLSLCLQDPVRTIGYRARRKGLEPILALAPQLPEWLIGDDRRLQQALLPMLDHAVQTTPRGAVELHVGLMDPGDAACRLAFDVIDQGGGIDPGILARVFDQSAPPPAEEETSEASDGLGLRITRDLAELMGGVLRLEKSDATGSHFRLELPFGLLAEPPDSPFRGGLDKLAGQQVLLVEDHPATRAVVGQTLVGWGLEVRQAASFDEALKAIQQASHDQRLPSAVVLDDRLGEASALELLKQWAQRFDFRPPSVLLISRTATQSEFQRDGLGQPIRPVAKPVLPWELGEALVELLGGRPEQPRPAADSASVSPPDSQGLTLLLVEDNPANRRLALKMLQRLGHRVLEADDGHLAVEQATHQAVDAILMDVQLPGIDGLEATRRIRKYEQEGGRRRTPIVAMTAHAFEEDRQRCLAAGMDEFLPKPLDLEHFQRLIARLMRGGNGAKSCSE